MFDACFKGDRELAINLIKNGDISYNYGLCGACNGGHKDLALLMIEEGATDFNWGLVNACVQGHNSLALLMIEKGANNWDWALGASCKGEHKDLAILMIEKGANINNCWLNFDEFDIDYLLDKKIKEFGRFKELADLCMERRKLADKIFKELNLRDVDSVIYTY